VEDFGSLPFFLFRAKTLRSKGAKKRRGDIFVIMSVIEEYRSLLDYQNEIY